MCAEPKPDAILTAHTARVLYDIAGDVVRTTLGPHRTNNWGAPADLSVSTMFP